MEAKFYALSSGSLIVDPIEKFDEPLAIDPKENFMILWIILWKFLIATTESGFDVYPTLPLINFGLIDKGRRSLDSSFLFCQGSKCCPGNESSDYLLSTHSVQRVTSPRIAKITDFLLSDTGLNG